MHVVYDGVFSLYFFNSLKWPKTIDVPPPSPFGPIDPKPISPIPLPTPPPLQYHNGPNDANPLPTPLDSLTPLLLFQLLIVVHHFLCFLHTKWLHEPSMAFFKPENPRNLSESNNPSPLPKNSKQALIGPN